MTPPAIQILMVEDNPTDALLVREELADCAAIHFELTQAERLGQGLELIGQSRFDAALLDLSLPDAHGLETVLRIREAAPALPIVVLTGQRDEQLGLEAVRLGAQDYLNKSQIGSGVLVRSLRFAIERKRAEEAVVERERQKEAQARLIEADRRKDEFLAMLAHELRNPLAPVRNAVEILRLLGSTDPVAQRQHEAIERQVRHMARLLEDLLDVSRITRGKIELRRRPLHLAEVLLHAVETAMPPIQHRRQQLHFTPPADALLVHGDLDRLVQVVGNLLNNASKFTEEGGQIWLEAWREGDEARLRVRDTGAGIAPEMLPRIFELFAQADQTLARSQGGLGIGLTMVQRLVQMHGGRVEAASPGPRQGSTFTVCLPALAEGAAADNGRTRASGPGSAPAARRILVVDDLADSASSLAELLTIWGHQVRVAHYGTAALEAARAAPPEIVLLDIGMPGMDGFEVARRLRAEHPDRRMVLVALTGYGQSHDRDMALQAGFDHHLIKPVDLERLHDLLTHAFD